MQRHDDVAKTLKGDNHQMSIKSVYGAGYRAGRATPRLVVVDGHKYIETPRCPFNGWRFVSWALWHEGLHNGTMQRLTMKGATNMTSDFDFHDHGTICVLVPMNENAQGWIDEHIGDDAMTWGGGIAIDHRCVDNILCGIAEDGFSINAA
jgi:hypothetical protein